MELLNDNLLDTEFDNFFGLFSTSKKEERKSKRTEKKSAKEKEKEEWDAYLAERKRRAGIDMDYMEKKDASLGLWDKDSIIKKREKGETKVNLDKYKDYISIFDKKKDDTVVDMDDMDDSGKSKPKSKEEEKTGKPILGMERKTGIVVLSVGGALVLGGLIFTVIKLSK